MMRSRRRAEAQGRQTTTAVVGGRGGERAAWLLRVRDTSRRRPELATAAAPRVCLQTIAGAAGPRGNGQIRPKDVRRFD